LIDQVIHKVQSYAPGADVSLIFDAYTYAAFCHKDQKRKSGDDYFIHPLAVAEILADLRMDVETIAVGLLHDTIEDTLASREQIEQRFGKNVAEMVDGVTKLSKLTYRGKVEEQAENFRKLVLAFGKDLRVIIVKVADRLHNMRTLEHQPREKQKSISKETMDIYAPLVSRLGLDLIKIELEDLCFRYLQPEEYAEITADLASDRPEREAYVKATSEILTEALASRSLNVEVTGRVKHLWSIRNKVKKSGKHISDLYDLLAFRVLVPDRESCYIALGFIHLLYMPMEGRFKDYIAVPKSNGYQSLHTTVVGPDGRPIEIQIRTPEMHRIADDGIAAHWRYKNGRLSISNAELERIARLRGFIQLARDVEDPADFMEAARSDLAANIHVFTPNKDVLLLPEGATALDFAYHVHTQVGNRACGAKVNGRMVPLRHPIKTGDTVEILTKADANPTRDWLSWATSHRALGKMRRRLRELMEDQGLGSAREFLDGALRKIGGSLKRAEDDRSVAERLSARGYKDLDALATDLLGGNISPGEAARIVIPDTPAVATPPTPGVMAAFLQRVRRQSENPILVNGETDIMVDYARCCRPMKGEPIIGYITRGRGMSIHKQDCAEVRGLDVDRQVAVAWDDRVSTLHQGLVIVESEDRPGLLAEITGLCVTYKINLWKADVRATHDRHARCELGVAVQDVTQLMRLMSKLRNVKGVLSVERA
jgi:GTP pyrophosphokinase